MRSSRFKEKRVLLHHRFGSFQFKGSRETWKVLRWLVELDANNWQLEKPICGHTGTRPVRVLFLTSCTVEGVRKKQNKNYYQTIDSILQSIYVFQLIQLRNSLTHIEMTHFIGHHLLSIECSTTSGN